MVNGHEQSYVSRMSYVLNENSDLLPLNSHILSLGIQCVKKNETVSYLTIGVSHLRKTRFSSKVCRKLHSRDLRQYKMYKFLCNNYSLQVPDCFNISTLLLSR